MTVGMRGPAKTIASAAVTLPLVIYRFRLLDLAGNDLGPFLSPEPDWQPGQLLPEGTGGPCLITAVVKAEAGSNFAAYLVVETEPPAPPDGQRSTASTRCFWA